MRVVYCKFRNELQNFNFSLRSINLGMIAWELRWWQTSKRSDELLAVSGLLGLDFRKIEKLRMSTIRKVEWLFFFFFFFLVLFAAIACRSCHAKTKGIYVVATSTPNVAIIGYVRARFRVAVKYRVIEQSPPFRIHNGSRVQCLVVMLDDPFPFMRGLG